MIDRTHALPVMRQGESLRPRKAAVAVTAPSADAEPVKTSGATGKSR